MEIALNLDLRPINNQSTGPQSLQFTFHRRHDLIMTSSWNSCSTLDKLHPTSQPLASFYIANPFHLSGKLWRTENIPPTKHSPWQRQSCRHPRRRWSKLVSKVIWAILLLRKKTLLSLSKNWAPSKAFTDRTMASNRQAMTMVRSCMSHTATNSRAA